MIDRIEYKQWTTTDRSTLETKPLSVDDFLGNFLGAIPKVCQHDFIAKQQSLFLQDSKGTITPKEPLVVGNFAENYSFVVQDAAQLLFLIVICYINIFFFSDSEYLS